MEWPSPNTAEEVRSFLGLAIFNLAPVDPLNAGLSAAVTPLLQNPSPRSEVGESDGRRRSRVAGVDFVLSRHSA